MSQEIVKKSIPPGTFQPVTVPAEPPAAPAAPAQPSQPKQKS